MPSSSTSNEHPPDPARLQEVEKIRPAFILTWTEVRLLGIAGEWLLPRRIPRRFARKKGRPDYGKELMLIILATILCLTTPTGSLSPDSCLIYLGMFRILLSVGVGGDHPMSASVTSDRTNLRKRGTMLAYIFSDQG
ncbi:hypothetical protein PM082_023126 [Marasmius tenuissimus]|nr:hypothetical protein PM082_023126 [Marasmius tenuissimus]